ncbi:MAG: TonB-dependent receptor [Candidatus Omnitrophica bacterium]|nr:TonB-dependent receptor [Candidatus Omnitrophota bacterium]
MKKNIVILVGLSILINSGGICLAKDTNTIDLEPITVTASRVARGMLEVPSSVSIVSEIEIKASNAKSVPELLRNLEGIYMYDASGVGTSGRVNMRGFWGGMSTHQLILIDGIPQNSSEDKLVDWNLIPLDNIERIEVVRGPNSALYGDAAMSGVINIITKRPSAIPETRISTSYGSFNTQNYKLSTSGFSKKLGYYLNLGTKSTNGFRKHSDYEDIHLNGKLDFLIDETQSLRFSLDYYDKERGAHPWAINETQIENDRRQARPGTENDKNKTDKLNLGLTYQRDISDICQAEGTLYSRYKDGESFYTSSGGSTYEQLKDEDIYGLLTKLNINPEIFGIEHSLTAGIDLERNDFDYEEYNAPNQIRGTIRKDCGAKREKIGPYLQDEIKLFEPFKLIAGLRYDLIKFDYTDYANESNSKKRDMSKITPKCGVVYNYQKDSNIYANYAQAFRTPTLAQMFTYGGSSANPDLNPEEAENYEIGVHHQFNDILKANVSLYWMELNNEIWYNYDDSQYKNYSETSHKGIETGLDFTIIEGLTSFANYTYTRAKNESGTYKGKYLTNIPIHKGSIGLRLETDFGLNINLNATRMGASYIDNSNSSKLSCYTVVDTRIGYEHKGSTFFLGIDNLLDKEYNSYGLSSKKFNPAPGRTFTFGTEVKF